MHVISPNCSVLRSWCRLLTLVLLLHPLVACAGVTSPGSASDASLGAAVSPSSVATATPRLPSPQAAMPPAATRTPPASRFEPSEEATAHLSLEERRFTPKEIAAELDGLFRTLETVHPDLYAVAPKPIVDRERERLLAGLVAPLGRSELYLRIAPLVAQLGDGHTALFPPQDEFRRHIERGGRLLPVELTLRERRAWVRGTTPGARAIPAGVEVLAINGVPTATLLDELVALVSGERDAYRVARVERQLDLLLWLRYGFVAPYAIAYRVGPDGEQRVATVSGATPSERAVLAARNGGSGDEVPYTYTTLPGGVGLLDFRAFRDRERFEAFLAATFATIQRDAVRHLVIDLRNNSGGNSALGDDLMSYLTERPFRQFARIDVKVSEPMQRRYDAFLSVQPGTMVPIEGALVTPGPNPLRFTGNVYLLIGPHTFSSATGFAAMVKDMGIGTLVGEETGGLPTSFGDGYDFVLPFSRLNAIVSYKFFVRPSGADDRRGVLPDHVVHSEPAEGLGGDDPVLAATLALITQASSR